MVPTTLLAIALLGSSQPQSAAADEAAYGYVEFTKDPKLFTGHSIRIYAVLEERNRLLYIDEMDSAGLRSLLLKTPAGQRGFVVVVMPVDGLAPPSDPERRTRPNVTVTVEPGMTTPVEIGGFTDFVRAPTQGDVSGTKFVTPSNDVEASQFRTQITVGKPEKR